MIFFTSDTHFDHANVIKHCNRPFSTVDEMNWALVANWNRKVSDSDTVYHLGDFTLGDIGSFHKWASKLNGYIRIVPGSHDHRWTVDFEPNSKITLLPPLVSLQVDIPELRVREKVLPIVICHYSMRTWNKFHYGSWHLYGHSHGNLPPLGMSMDVGVDCMDFTPVSILEVSEIFKRRSL